MVYKFKFIQLFLQAFITRSHWSGSRPLTAAIPWILGSHWGYSWISYCCLCHRDLVALTLQVQPLRMIQNLIDKVGVGVSYLTALVMGLSDGSWVTKVHMAPAES